ncbi:MAG: ATPase, T2SS/T4P/T4SS family [Candidatus Moraniibacteriota bacterium]
MKNEKIKDILIKTGYLEKKELKDIEKEVEKEGADLIGYLIDNDYISREIIGQAVAENYDIPFVDLSGHVLTKEKKELIPREAAEKFRAVVVKKDKYRHLVATDNPEDAKIKISLAELLGSRNFKLAYALPEDINDVLKKYQKSIDSDLLEDMGKGKESAEELVEEIIKKAIFYGASDVHMDPEENSDCLVRYRVDGILREVGKLSGKRYELAVNKFKVMADLKIDEHMLPQDGAIRYKRGEKKTDLRISVTPVVNGEKIVLRVLNEYVKNLSFSELGMSERIQEQVRQAIKKPFGMILVAGPTGSGKTTSLYSMLIKINQPGVNVITIEDPVEYRIKGINHIQVNPKIGLTFAKGLRSIVRQDPDIILVGEIRDTKTAQISVNAALTGHLMLSTFHANNSAVAVTRLLNMEIESFAFASTAELVISQRLARKICVNCRHSYEKKASELKKDFPGSEKYFQGRKVTLYKGKGCPKCQGRGYEGRIGVFESIKITLEMQKLIMEKPSADRIWELARKQGAESFFEDGIKKIEQGMTTLEELYRVAPPRN